MPYLHERDAQTLRDVLRSLRQNRVSTERLLFEIHGDKKPPIGRSSLDKFVGGANSNNPKELEVIWEHLRKNYLHHFPKINITNPGVFAAALGSFFKSEYVRDTFHMEDVVANMLGKYVMYRSDWAPHKEPGYYRVSIFEIEILDGGVCVSETQDFRHQQPPFEQKDSGAIFMLGAYIYFLTKEEDGTCVKLGVVNTVFPTLSNKRKTEWFQGIIFGASHLGIFPSVRFFCRRTSSKELIDLGVMKLDGVGDQEASSYLLS